MRISDWSADVCSSDRHRILRRSSGDLSNRRFHARLRGRSGIREAVRDVSAVFVAATIQAVIVVEPLTNWTSRTGWKRLRFTLTHDDETETGNPRGRQARYMTSTHNAASSKPAPSRHHPTTQNRKTA